MQRLTTAQTMDYGTVCGLIGALSARYSFLGTAPIGCSRQGRKIFGITLGGGKHRVLITAAFHGTESLTSLICLRLCEDLCEALYRHRELNGWDIHRAMIGRTIVFVPMVNPDVTYDCTAEWEKMQPFESKSAAEIEALTDLCRRCDFRHSVSLCGTGETIDWQYGTHTPPQSELMARVLSATSGYSLSPNTQAISEDLKDWFIDTFHRPGFVLKLGKAAEGISIRNFETIYQKAQEMLLISALL